jgi:hypothetical protein
VLRRAIGGCFAISIKTRLADVLKCPDDLWHTPLGRRVCQKHVAAIELDDRTHDKPERRRRDDFLDDAFCSAAVVLVRVRAARRYDAKALQNQIEGMISPTRSGMMP